MDLHPTLIHVTERIVERSRRSRGVYLDRIVNAKNAYPIRTQHGCTNFAHAIAALPADAKLIMRETRQPNIGIVSAYNDMLSAHQPFEKFPAIIKEAARKIEAVAQFAGGVPAMCDGVTQGEPGMELSLFSRDVIALSTAIALSHNTFDAALCLGICDKIVPGLLIGALKFGHLPVIFVPGGPMTTGIPNDEKTRIRQLYAEGKVGREELLEAETKSYHGPGTCTFYGTANSNQMMMEVMGLHLPSSAFVNPYTPLRDALTIAATQRAARITALGDEYLPLGHIVDERSIVNAIVALLATGGSTNHTMHLVVMAAAAGVRINWDDFNDLSAIVPSIAKIYPNGKADVNQFQAAGGVGFVVKELLNQGVLHEDVLTVMGRGLQRYATEPWLNNGKLEWRSAPAQSFDETVLVSASKPFSPDGGLKLLTGNLGRAVIKVSAVKPQHRVVEAPALVFNDQEEVLEAFHAKRLRRDFVAVVRFQGPRAIGMPELHKLTPPLGVLQDQGFHVALVTDGRMSGASGKVPSAIHVTPECLGGGPLSKVRNGDIILLDAEHGLLEAKVSDEEWRRREPATTDLSSHHYGLGRGLFVGFRTNATSAEQGATSLGVIEADEESVFNERVAVEVLG